MRNRIRVRISESIHPVIPQAPPAVPVISLLPALDRRAESEDLAALEREHSISLAYFELAMGVE